jgi:hypothetical protein
VSGGVALSRRLRGCSRVPHAHSFAQFVGLRAVLRAVLYTGPQVAIAPGNSSMASCNPCAALSRTTSIGRKWKRFAVPLLSRMDQDWEMRSMCWLCWMSSGWLAPARSHIPTRQPISFCCISRAEDLLCQTECYKTLGSRTSETSSTNDLDDGVSPSEQPRIESRVKCEGQDAFSKWSQAALVAYLLLHVTNVAC